MRTLSTRSSATTWPASSSRAPRSVIARVAPSYTSARSIMIRAWWSLPRIRCTPARPAPRARPGWPNRLEKKSLKASSCISGPPRSENSKPVPQSGGGWKSCPAP